LKKNSEDQSSVELRNMEINLLLEEKNKWEDEKKGGQEEVGVHIVYYSQS
jgi:hypothetical protein